MPLFLGALLVLLCTGLPWFVLSARARTKAIARERRRIDDALDALGLEQGFDANRAALLREMETVGTDEEVSVQVQRIYRSGRGQYFLFICRSGESGCLTAISRERTIETLRSTPQLLSREFPDLA